jgi:UrcA family protein
MNTSIRSITALVIVLAALSTRANATSFVDPVNVITVSAPVEKVVSRDALTGVPQTEIMVVARVKTDPVVLTMNSGVALFKDSVYEAARRACGADDSHGEVDVSCVHSALKAAKPQVNAVIAAAQVRNATSN